MPGLGGYLQLFVFAMAKQIMVFYPALKRGKKIQIAYQ
jgi:hypothetical protein